MKTIKGNLILTKDTVFDESIVVEGAILDKDGICDLKVRGDIKCLGIYCRNIDCINIDCHNIDCYNIDCHNIVCHNIVCYNIDCHNIVCYNIVCYNIDCHNIDCYNIDCHNIDCYDINASFILCESMKQKKGSKLIARNVITKRSAYIRKEQKAIE